MTSKIRKSAASAWWFCLTVLAASFASSPARAVILDGMNQCTVKLSDGTDVVLYGEFISKLTARGDESETPLVPFDRARHLGVFEGGVATRNAGDDAARRDQDQAIANSQARFQQLRNEYANQIDKDKKFEKQPLSNRFHYLPPNNALHLSKRPDGTPEFLFVRYTTDKKESEGGTQGGLMHFLMELSMTPIQEAELRALVATKCKGDEGAGILVGSVEVNEAEEKGSFQIVSAILSDTGMTRSRVQSGHAPVLPGGKLAAAANLSATGAQLFLSTVDKRKGSIADLSVELNYSYVVQMPAARGAIFFHWSKMQETAEQFMQYERTKSEGGWFEKDEIEVTKEQVETFMNFAAEKSVVEFIFEGYNPDSEFTKTILEAMTDYFLNSMMEASDDPDMKLPTDEDEGSKAEETQQASGKSAESTYKINKRKLAQSWSQKDQVDQARSGPRGAQEVQRRRQPRELVRRREGQSALRHGGEPERSVLPASRHPLHPRPRREGHLREDGELRDRQRAQAARERQ